MSERIRCSALQADSKCKNGFPVTGPCHGTDGNPICMSEKACGRIYSATEGVPIEIKRALSNGDVK